VWSSVLDGRRLTFRLAGINNQNFVMRDEQTGSWWQQVSGQAILGPLKGKRLTLVPHDELMFVTWKAEEPAGRVLKTDPKIVKEEEYEPADWEDHVGKYPVKVAKAPGGPLEPRTLIVGIAIKGKSKGKTVKKGGTSTVTATLKKGTYTFYCPVPGHEAGGMKGKLIVS